MTATESEKAAAGREALRFVQDGMTVGLGTGSTVHYAIVGLAEQGLDVVCASTSDRTTQLATENGLSVRPIGSFRQLDIGIDGADEVAPDFWLVKGGGGALAREKVVAELCDRWIVVCDSTKPVERLGEFGLPIEALPYAVDVVEQWLATRCGATTVDRQAEPSDNGNPLLRARLGAIVDPAALAAELDTMPGVIEHGLFSPGLVERVLVGMPDDTVRDLPRRSEPLKTGA